MDTTPETSAPVAPKKPGPKPKPKVPKPPKVLQPLPGETSEPGTPEYRHRVKVAKEAAAAKAKNKVVESWVELGPTSKTDKKGAKVILAEKALNGNVFRSLLGYSKTCESLIKKAKAEGTLRYR